MKKEIKIAIVAILGLVLLFFGMNYLRGISMFSNNDLYYIEFEDITGVGGNCPVYADGVMVGNVQDIEYDYNHEKPTRLTAYIDKMMRIPKGTTAIIDTDLMGNTRINLLLVNNMRERVMPGEVIEGLNSEKIIARVTQMLPTIEAMVPKLDSIMSSLNSLLADPALRNTLHNAETITGNLTTTTAQLNSLMATLNHNVPGMLTKADAILDNAQKISGDIAETDLKATLAEVDRTIKDVQLTVQKLNSNESTAGCLLNDTQLYDQLVNTVKDADSLVTDLKAHPKRYVHFSVFGRKN